MGRGYSPTWPLPAQVQTFLHINPVCLLVIDTPAFTAKQGLDPHAAVADTGLGNLPDPCAQDPVIRTMGPVVKRRALDAHGTGRPAPTHTIGFDQEMRQLAAASRLDSFLRTTS